MERKVVSIIEDENPINHWGFLPIENKIVLDLGCGLNSQFEPTPWYFLQNRKAKKVYGVDPDLNSYNWYKQNYNVQNFIPFMDYVDRLEKIEWYIENSKASVIKMDIEGSEVMMHALNPKYLKNVDDIAIEYHNFPCLVSCERLLEDNGFMVNYHKFKHLDLEHQGVIHGYRFKEDRKQDFFENAEFVEK